MPHTPGSTWVAVRGTWRGFRLGVRESVRVWSARPCWSVAPIDAGSAQVSPLERRGEALGLPGDKSTRRLGRTGGAATCAECNLIFKWLKDRRFALAYALEAALVFLPVEIHGGEVPPARMESPDHRAHGRVEIVLATAHRVGRVLAPARASRACHRAPCPEL